MIKAIWKELLGENYHAAQTRAFVASMVPLPFFDPQIAKEVDEGRREAERSVVLLFLRMWLTRIVVAVLSVPTLYGALMLWRSI